MSLDLVSSVLWAESGSSWLDPRLALLVKLLVAVPLPLFLAFWLARWLKMRDYGWKLALIFCSLAIAAVVIASFPLKLGVDLKGGVILVYEIDREALKASEGGDAPASVDWGKLLQSLNNRINPAGTKEIVVRRYGEWQVEIIVPDIDPPEVARIKRLISTAGSLEFRIVANRTDHDYVIAAAELQAEDPLRRRSRYVTDEGKQIGFWARVDRQSADEDLLRPFKTPVIGDILRDAGTGEILLLPPDFRYDQKLALERYLQDRNIDEIDVLMAADDGYNITGEHLGAVRRGFDEYAAPCVQFNMRGTGVGLMAGLTTDNLPDKQRQFSRRLGIMLDGVLKSAPAVRSTISDRGMITGDFTQEEVDFLVGILQAGSLPAALVKTPISENQIGAVVGEDTIRKGTWAAGISLAVVLLFMLFWYRFAGIIACVALAANLLLIVALMKFPLQAPLTLPGLAGLILTVGMSVDANVLIYERMREEVHRGSALRMAIRNGFDRATTTIVDSNVTTLISALVLYVIGTDQIRGFAVTLILGILMSMFTAVFCSRVVFEILERKRWISSLGLRQLVGDLNIDFIGKRWLAVGFSLLLIGVSLLAMVARGQRILDIDFTGGTSVVMILNQPTEEREIRAKLDQQFAGMRVDESAVQYSVNRVDMEGQSARTVWKIDSSLAEVDQLEEVLQSTFSVAMHVMDYTSVEETRQVVDAGGAAAGANPPPAGSADAPASGTAGMQAPAAETELPNTQTPEEPAATPATEASAQPADPERKAEAAPPAAAAPSESLPVAPASPTAAEPPAPVPAANSEAVSTPPSSESNDSDDAAPAPEQGARRTDLPSSTWLALAGDGVLLAQADAPPPAAGTPEQPPVGSPEEPKPAVEPAAMEAQVETPAAAPAQPEEGAAKPEAVTEKPAAEAPAGSSTPDPTVAIPAAAPVGAAKPAEDSAKPAVEPAAPTANAAAPDDAPPTLVVSRSTVKFDYEIDAGTLQYDLLQAAEATGTTLTDEDIELSPATSNPDWTMDSSIGDTSWTVSLKTDAAAAEKILGQLQQKLRETPAWTSSNKIGGKVAGDTRTQAIFALLASMALIVLYIWVRFQQVIFGLAAVLALVHDVLVTLGALAISYWLAGLFSQVPAVNDVLMIEEFKINLAVVAALLTIIGYSLNDTIVIFDRIREVRGKSPDVTAEMINRSVNQTLSRTLLTAFTTLMVVVIMYFIGGAGVHAFAFAMIVGVVAGTYSTVYIATPLLLWMLGNKNATA